MSRFSLLGNDRKMSISLVLHLHFQYLIDPSKCRATKPRIAKRVAFLPLDRPARPVTGTAQRGRTLSTGVRPDEADGGGHGRQLILLGRVEAFEAFESKVTVIVILCQVDKMSDGSSGFIRHGAF